MPKTSQKKPAPRLNVPFGRDASRMKALGNVASEFKAWRPAPEVLKTIQAVPTIFPQYNVLTGIGGHPTACVSVLHGPSNEGKSSLMLGLGRSYLERGHFFAIVDAERTTPVSWSKQMIGESHSSPGFVALPSSAYEEIVDGVREFCTKIADSRRSGNLPDDVTALIVVDSIRKMFPKALLANLLKDGAAAEGKGRYKKSKGVDGFGGRGAQIKAALNAAWLDELIPMMSDTNCSIVLVAREIEEAAISSFMAPTQRVGGGAAVNYDATLRIRVSRSYIADPNDKEKIVGERHGIEVHKTKLTHKTEKVPVGHFHTSNGVLTPLGFDRFRDVLELATKQGVIEKKGAWYNWGELRVGQGEVEALRWLMLNQSEMMEIEQRAIESALEVTAA